MAFRRFLRGGVSDDELEGAAREAASRQGETLRSFRIMDTNNWLSTPCVVNETFFIKVITAQNSFVHGMLTRTRNIGALSSGKTGFFEHFDTPLEMAKHEFKATEKMIHIGLNAPKPLEAFEYEGYGVLVLKFLPEFRTLDELNRKEVRRFVPSMFESLSSMHAAGLAHGDLRAENVLVSDGTLYFIDATKIDTDAIADARAYDVACALAALEPHVGATIAVETAAEYYPANVLRVAKDYLAFVNLRPDHGFDDRTVRSEIIRQVE